MELKVKDVKITDNPRIIGNSGDRSSGTRMMPFWL